MGADFSGLVADLVGLFNVRAWRFELHLFGFVGFVVWCGGRKVQRDHATMHALNVWGKS